MADPLKLKARTPADLEVFSAVLQDAVVRVGDMAYLKDEHRFAAVVNRFLWEKEMADGSGEMRRKTGERVRTGLHFDGVLKAEAQNVPMGEPEHVMALLAIECEEKADGAAVIQLAFSGYCTIRLQVECIEASLQDMTEPWRARRRPAHAVE